MTGARPGCLACDLAAGRRELPGGRIHETDHWLVEHCVGPLGIGTLIVKPRRQVVHVRELSAPEAAELGPLLRRVAAVIAELARPEQVYVGLWSHAGGRPVHVHWVVPARDQAPDGGDRRPRPSPPGGDVRPRRAAGSAAVELVSARARRLLSA